MQLECYLSCSRKTPKFFRYSSRLLPPVPVRSRLHFSGLFSLLLKQHSNFEDHDNFVLRFLLAVTIILTSRSHRLNNCGGLSRQLLDVYMAIKRKFSLL